MTFWEDCRNCSHSWLWHEAGKHGKCETHKRKHGTPKCECPGYVGEPLPYIPLDTVALNIARGETH